jgi:hypothetical protein
MNSQKGYRFSYAAAISGLGCLAVSCIWFGCAGQLPPDGGPPDTIPPQIVAYYPQNNTTLYSDNKLKFEFDEYVDKRSFEESVFISPSLAPLEFNWSGTEVKIAFAKELRKNTTYVVNIGTDVVDYRNRNRMAQAFTIAFSTGDSINVGRIEGSIIDKDPTAFDGMMVFAYKLDGLDADTLDPRTYPPDFVTQTGKTGIFKFSHLPFGTFRILAVRDEYRNLLYDPETDKFAVPFSDLRLKEKDTLVSGIRMKIGIEDTTAPRLIKAEALNNKTILAEFSEPIDTTGADTGNFSIVDTLNSASLPILSSSSIEPKKFRLISEPQDSTVGYRMNVKNFRDMNGLMINAQVSSVVFSGSGKTDTVKPAIVSISLRDSASNVPLSPIILLTFSKPIKNINTLMSILSIGDSIQIPSRSCWINDFTYSITSTKELASKKMHRLRIKAVNIEDYFENKMKDTTVTLRFTTVDVDNFSSFDGTVIVEDTVGMLSPVVVVTEQVGSDQKPLVQKLDPAGRFQFKNLPEGKYVLWGFKDRNNNGKFDPGRPFPFLSSERFYIYPDTLKLRPRWPLEGIQFRFK